MLTIRLFDTNRPVPRPEGQTIARIMAAIGGAVTRCGRTSVEGHNLVFVAASTTTNQMEGIWLDDGVSVYPMTFRIINGPGRDTGWCEPSFVPDDYRFLAESVRRAMEHGDFALQEPGTIRFPQPLVRALSA